MNGEAECPTDLEMTAPKNQDRWSQEDMLTLLECMKNNLPSNDGSKFKTTESHLDWEKVAFKDFSGEMCKMKWMEISNEVRKFRTLTELIMDAEEHVKNPYKGKKLKKHPDFPKKPLTPYFRFFMEKRAKYAKLHPEMSNLDLTKILSKKYKELPEKKKMKYIQDFQREKQEFERNLARFREDHPDLIQNAKKSDVPEKPKTPQQLWYNHEKKIYLKVRPDEIMRDYIQKHPELNLSEEGITRSTLTKAERQLKDKFDGRPTKPPPNSYSLYCAELMANMKDVPSTERMVLCSQQWKLLSQKEKDAYHKKCDQKKKDYEIELLRFLESLPEEEQQRVLGEEKMLGGNRKGATSPASKKSSPETGKASSEKPKRPISAMFIFSEEKRKQLQEERPELSESELTRLLARMWNDLSEKKKAKYKAREAAMKAQSEKKHGSDKEERGKLPESPKTAEEIWQQSVIGDYLARFKNDRSKALKAMEATWNNMEKKEKLMWIKKAAEDQKRYERELSEMRAPPCSTNAAKKMKFQGEPKKPPMNGYQKFSQELLSNGELNHLPLKERMVEIGSRWQRISQGQKEHYKKLAEEQQKQYKVHLDIWLKSLSPQERAAYKEHTSNKRKSIGKMRGPNPKMKPTMQSKSESEDDDDDDDDDEEDEKTDDSADEMLDGASDFPSEEEVDVEKVDACEYSEDDEQVDIETVEELSEKINIARLKATAAHIRPSKQKYHARNSSDEKLSEKPTKQKPHFWNRKQKTEAEAFAHYRQTHTANERRRRNEMRDLFEKLKRALGLHNLPKVSKCYILKQAYEEIQGLTDQADKLIGQKNLLSRKQDVLIRKVSTLSGKTEEVVLKKLEYIYAKQKAVEAQKKKKQPEPEEAVVTSTASTQQEASAAPSRDLGQVAVTNRRGKPLILARKGGHAKEETSSSLTLTAASLVMTPQGQVLTLKSPLVPGQVAAVPSTLLQAELKPRAATTTMTTQQGIASVMIQLPGSTVPVQVKGILTNSTIPITLSTVAGNPVPSTVVPAAEPSSEIEDSFMMPKIVNVTSLAAEGSMNLNLNRNKGSSATATAGTQISEKSVAAAPPESRKSDSILSEEKGKPCAADSGGDGRSTTGPTKVFFENKDAFPQLRNVPCAKEPPDSFSKKLCVGEFVGSQARRKDSDPGRERLKTKELPFHKLQIKDSRIEMELRKVASAMEEAELDVGELLGSIEESDDTDETLTSLLNEIAFLNQQLNDDASGMSELPNALNSDFSHGDSEVRRGTTSDLSAADSSSFQFGPLGGSFKDLSEVPEGGGSISPLLLHLEDDDLTDGDKASGEPSSEADVLKIVIGAEMKDSLPNPSGESGKMVTSPMESASATPPVLQMKTNAEAGNADTLWRPMPKLAPLGLKVASLPVDSEGQSAKVMPLLAPVVAKLTPTGSKTSSSATVQEGQDNKVMPTLAPVVTKLSNSGTLPSNSTGK